MSNRVKIYVVECTKAYAMYEQGSGFSLSPWGSDTEYYQGDDDGGTYYDLPDNYELAATRCGEPAIYCKDSESNYYHCDIINQNFDKNCDRAPVLVSSLGISAPLTISANQQDDNDN